MERKLASIQTILKLEPIEGADKIEKATVLGWHLVVKKGEFQVGDKGIFCEPDSILPDAPWSEFLRDRGFRIKTVRLRKQISQGIFFPLSILPVPVKTEQEGIHDTSLKLTITDGMDVTDMLGITKYEPYVPAQLAGQAKGNFPDFLHKTDEIRIQAEPNVLERHKGTKVYISEKVDGSSMTVYFRKDVSAFGHEFGVCSRNLDLKETEGNSYWKCARALDLENKLSALDRDISLQGELVGQGIQSNKYGMSDINFFVFNVFDIAANKYLDFQDFQNVVSNLGLTSVPIIESEHILNESVDELVALSNRVSLLNPNTPNEGIVIRPITESYDEALGRFSFKVINPEFLLKYKE